MCWKADTCLHILLNALHASVLIENNYLVWFEHTHFPVFINHFTANPGCCKTFWPEAPSWQITMGVTTDLMPANLKNYIIPLISAIIQPNVLTLRRVVEAETLVVIYWNLYVALNHFVEMQIETTQLYKIVWCSVSQHTCKYSCFIVNINTSFFKSSPTCQWYKI